MTPLELQCALHYYTTPVDWPAMRQSGTHIEYVEGLVMRGFLESTPAPVHPNISITPAPPPTQRPKYQATEKLKVFVEHLMTIPDPVQNWSIPDVPSTPSHCPDVVHGPGPAPVELYHRIPSTTEQEDGE